MREVLEVPECAYCRSINLESIYSRAIGMIDQCNDCGFSSIAAAPPPSVAGIEIQAG